MVGTIGVSFDEELDRIIVVLEEVGVDDEDDDDDEIAESGHMLRVAMTREQAAAFAITRRGWSKRAGRHARCVRCLWTPGSRLPAYQRAPAAHVLTEVSNATVERVLTEGEMEVHGRIAGARTPRCS